MTATPATRVGMPLDEFMALSNEQPFELINGERIPKMPNPHLHSNMLRKLFRFLDGYALERQWGDAYMETTFILPTTDFSNWVTGSRIPDLMFYCGSRVKDYEAAYPELLIYPLALVPDLVVEVMSPNDKAVELEEKIDVYLSDGVRLIWRIDQQRRKVFVYRPDAEFTQRLSVTERLDGEDVLPEFQLDLTRLFE
jgi:Uma2 family endonuclease